MKKLILSLVALCAMGEVAVQAGCPCRANRLHARVVKNNAGQRVGKFKYKSANIEGSTINGTFIDDNRIKHDAQAVCAVVNFQGSVGTIESPIHRSGALGSSAKCAIFLNK